MTTTPIAIFAFRRPDHLERTLVALAANHGARDHDVVAYCDGPRNASDHAGIAGVARVLDDWAGRGSFRSFAINRQKTNLGLRRSIIRGVSKLCAEAGSVIVVEDDIETSPWFLRYCQDGLDLYALDDAVASIHGYIYPIGAPLPETFFLRGADCWGWATWRRAWNRYEDDAALLLRQLQEAKLTNHFNHGGARDLISMLTAAQAGRVDSWAIRWHASTMLAGMHTLYPGRTLVRNIGLDASGSHGDNRLDGLVEPPHGEQVHVLRQPIVEHHQAWEAIGAHFRQSLRGGLLARIARRLRRLIGARG